MVIQSPTKQLPSAPRDETRPDDAGATSADGPAAVPEIAAPEAALSQDGPPVVETEAAAEAAAEEAKPAAPATPPPPAQSAPPGPETLLTKLKPAPKWIDAPPLSPYRAMLHRLHRLHLDRGGNGLDRTATGVETPLRDLETVGANRDHGHDYRATPRTLVGWVLDALPGPFDHTTFLDIGSGRGRVLFEAARRPFHRIVGIEFARELHEDAELNLRHWPRGLMRCREVDLILGDAFETPLPRSDLVVWMFDPFSERLMTRMAARLAEHAREWHVTLVLVDPRNPMAFRESPTFQPFEPPPAIRRKLALLSPYAVRIFTAGPR